MFFKRIMTPGLSIFSYLLGDEKLKKCVVIDPTRHVVPYIIQAQTAGLEITDILETHVHADFVSGSKELKHQLNEKPTIHASGMGGSEWIPDYADQVVHQGTILNIGDVRLEARHTPGHTPEHLIWLCYDNSRSQNSPWFAFTGDCLFVSSVGRPDLLGEKETSQMAQRLYHSLFHVLAPLPDFLEIFPTHGEGSLCGKALNTRDCSTLGYERLYNPYLKQEEEGIWVEKLLQGLSPVPSYFHRLKKLNLKGTPLLSSLKTTKWGGESSPRLNQLFLLDVRHPEIFAHKHLKGALNIPLSHTFSYWAGWMLPVDVPIGIVVENSHLSSDAIEQLRIMGFDQEIWVIQMESDQAADPTLFTSLEMIDVQELANPSSATSFFILDVRTIEEWGKRHLPHAHHVEIHDLAHSVDQLPHDRPIALICRTGQRSSLAASILKKLGFDSIFNVRGGMQAWKSSLD